MEGRWLNFLVRQKGPEALAPFFNFLNPQTHLLYPLYMGYLLAALLLLPVLVSAQELHTFRNGEVADADKRNESLQYILNNASGGCSATQQDNSVLIECADGTTAVVPGYGTVFIVPSGSISGSVPDISSIPVSQIYVVDANDVAIGALYRVDIPETRYEVRVDWSTEDSAASGHFYFYIDNRDEAIHFFRSEFFYASEDCTGQPVVSPGDSHNLIYSPDDKQFYVVASDYADNFLAKSSKPLPTSLAAQADYVGACNPTEQILRIRLPIPYTPAPEILNAAYPVRLEQLP